MLTQYQKEALDFNTHILLSANAGSGKTFVLAKRFVNILLNENVELENLVAITFTDKAAGELNKRIALEIEERLLNETDANLKRRLENIRRQLVFANISTIHSFCVNVLREFAPEAGIDANFNPVDQLTADEILDQSINESMNKLIIDTAYEKKLKYLIRFFGSRRILERHIKNAIGSRKIIEQNLKEIYSKSEQEIAEYFKNRFDDLFNSLYNERINNVIKIIQVINKFVLDNNKNSQTAISILEILKDYSDSLPLNQKMNIIKSLDKILLTNNDRTVRTQGYLKKNREYFIDEIKIVEEFFSEIKYFYELDKIDELHLELAHFGKWFLDVYDYILNVYTEKKHQRSYVDFEDILLLTQKILELDEVKEYLRAKYKYIMIDEYQDTNELQYKIFMPILDYLKQGNLFVVGDEKQSIYMFRDAELEIFNKTKVDIKESVPEGKLLNLPHSFRMAPQIVLFTNTLFSKLFSNPSTIYNDVENSELICTKNESEEGAVEILFADENGISEAEMVTNKIIEITSGENKKVNLSDIGILCRKRDFFEELEKEFVKKKIPYIIIGGKGFYQNQIVYDVYNYISFLLNLNDDAALIGILRSPFYTISDRELFAISLENGNSFFDKLIQKSNEEEKYKKIVDTLLKHQKLTISTEPYFLIRQILLDTNYWSIIAAKRNSEQDVANLEKLISLARDYSRKSFKNLYDFVIALKNSIKTIEDESQAQIFKDKDAVKLLTIHQAKGLEFKVVFLYGCNNYAKEDTVKTKSLNVDKNFGLLVKVPLNKNIFGGFYTPPIVSLYNHINYKKNIAEIKRLLYVAVTRAKNYLYISLSHKNFKPQRDSFFYFIDEALKPDYTVDSIDLQGKIKYMKQESDNYIFYDKDYHLEIPLIKEVKSVEINNQKDDEIEEPKELIIEKISDRPKGEIFSATKISIFNQCPWKYELIYELGYTTIYDMIKKYYNVYEFNFKEEEELQYHSDVKGRVIHSVLKENPEVENLEELIERYLKEESINDENAVSLLKQKIYSELERFCSSELYKNLLQTKSKNEIEIYCKEGEHYLFGIIDKLIFENDKIIIVDYKTDNINDNQIEERANEYFIQLQFYAYILSKYYKEYNSFLTRIIFTKYPANVIEKEITRNELSSFSKKLNDIISKIINNEFNHNLNHCSKCNFALDGGKCVKQIARNY